MATRTFFPVGQGAFYAEKHKEFNIVYDCGCMGEIKKSQKVVRQSFSKNESVDVLFISHFDFDHISLIETLRDTVKTIRHVIFPLLSDEQKILIGNIYDVVYDGDVSNIIKHPEAFFGDETKITYIGLSNDNDVNVDNPIVLDGNQPKNIDSGTLIKIEGISVDYNWCFIPYNIENEKRSSELEDKLTIAGFDVGKLKTNPSYAIDNIVNVKERKAIKEIYESLDGNINENSLVVYSGPYDIRRKHSIINYDLDHEALFRYLVSCDHYLEFPCDRVACVFTGDVDLNKFDITKVFGSYWNAVGTVQIPHHGSLHNFKPDFLKFNIMYCPISFGTKNTYGHPSYDVIGEIIKEMSYVVKVTENMDSGYVQYIDI
ncbi:TPA: MBL fold metallo-hydrolase [Morganella morganii]|nr:MBL fold metallo-hydrolase [Morganella morganii]